jgi:hypothetical protein|tara:strand:- start:5829 stop:7265 length:1437 start_codon:yes stop_codon:yes gene_type:complete
MTKLNVLVENVYPRSFKCLNTRIAEKLQSLQPKTKGGWHGANLNVWNDLRTNGEHFNFISVDEYNINDTAPVIYLITIPFINDHLNTTWTRWIPDLTLKVLKEKNIPIVLSQPQEYYLGHLTQLGYHHFTPTEELSLLSQALDQIGLNYNDIIIHGIAATCSKPGFFEVGTRRVYEAYNYSYFTKGERFCTDWLEQDLTSPAMQKYKYLTAKDHLNACESKDKTSVCFNRQPRDLRCVLLLASEDKMDESVFTFLAEEPLHVPMSQQDIFERLENSIITLPEGSYKQRLHDAIEPLMKRLPLQLDELEGERIDHMNANYVLNQQRKRAWFEMVTETHEWQKKDYAISIITEKTIWPIINNMPFCIQGHKENYQFLKDLGFDLFEDTLLNQEAHKRDLLNTDLNKSTLHATDQMYERFNAWNKNWKFLSSIEHRLEHNFNLLTKTDWNLKEKNDFIKICDHANLSKRSFDIYLSNKFKF